MQYWKKIDTNGNTTTVESHSFHHKLLDAIRISKKEFDAYIASLPVVEPEPVVDSLVKITELEARIAILEEK